MAIDARIPLMGDKVEWVDPYEGQRKRAQIGLLEGQEQRARAQAERLGRDEKDMETAAKLIGSGGLTADAVAKVMAKNPRLGVQLEGVLLKRKADQRATEKAEADAQKSKAEADAAKAAEYGQIVGSMVDEDTKRLGIEALVKRGHMSAEEAPQWISKPFAELTPVIQQATRAAMTTVQQAEQTRQAEIQKRAAETHAAAQEAARAKNIGEVAGLLSAAQSQAQWDGTLSALSPGTKEFFLKQLGPMWSPEAAQLALNLGMDPAQRVAAKDRATDDARAEAAAAEARRHNKTVESQGWSRLSTDRERDKLLTPNEAAMLQVPYGTTREQARGNTPSTEAQKTTANYASRLAAANKILDDVGGKFAGTIRGTVQKLSPNVLQSDQGQQFEQAKLNFMTAILRRESGAAISTGEYETADKQYFPQPGDGPGVIKQKKSNRDIALRNLKDASGSAYQEPPTMDGEKIRVKRKSDGQTGTIDAKDFNPATYEKL